LVSNTEFTEKVICTASKKYQKLKIQQLEQKELSKQEYTLEYEKIIDKACLCVGLSASGLIVNNIDNQIGDKAVAICPGPNLAYFSGVSTLKNMVDHIYGRSNILKRNDRPNMFVKELRMYVDYFRNKVTELQEVSFEKQMQGLQVFREKLNQGIEYYKELFSQKLQSKKLDVVKDFEVLENELNNIEIKFFMTEKKADLVS